MSEPSRDLNPNEPAAAAEPTVISPPAELGHDPQGHEAEPLLDARTPTANFAGRDNIVADGPGTIGDFVHP